MQDLFKQITDQIIAAIEEGVGDFTMPWHAGAAGQPVNAGNRRPYRGINTLLLWAEARRAGYASPRWATYRQWTEMGAQVRKGQTSTTVLFWKGLGSGSGRDDAGGDESDTRARIVARSFRVFNASQVDGYHEQPPDLLADIERIDHAEQFLKRLPAAIWYGADSAFYDVRSDTVSMPSFAAFRSPVSFYSVLAHELVHWSGAHHRLGRDLKQRFGSEAYAMEELIAEIGAAFLGAQLGLAIEPRRDHAPYIANWLRVLRDDPRAIVTAASKAQIAVTYLTKLACPPGNGAIEEQAA